jgi:hypothetical protein
LNAAAFLGHVSETYDKRLVKKLNAACRQRKYQDEVFKLLSGKTLAELDQEWRASLRRKL